MYYYIYDAFLTHKKYDRLLAKIEGRLTDLGIKNKVIKFNLLKNFKELVRDAVMAGAQNIIAVGNNNTLSQLVTHVVGFNITIGLIPIGDNNSFAEYLGIPIGEQACDILSTRKTENIDVGTVNGQYFLSFLEAVSNNTKFNPGSTFSISTPDPDIRVGIYNFHPLINSSDWKTRGLFDPQDGKLELLAWPDNKQKNNKINTLLLDESIKNRSLFKGNKFQITHDTQSKNILVDGWHILKTPLEVGVKRGALKVIVGRERKF